MTPLGGQEEEEINFLGGVLLPCQEEEIHFTGRGSFSLSGWGGQEEGEIHFMGGSFSPAFAPETSKDPEDSFP